MTENFYVIRFTTGAYMTIESQEKISENEQLIWQENGAYFGVPVGDFKVAYGPCSEAEAKQFLRDIF